MFCEETSILIGAGLSEDSYSVEIYNLLIKVRAYPGGTDIYAWARTLLYPCSDYNLYTWGIYWLTKCGLKTYFSMEFKWLQFNWNHKFKPLCKYVLLVI